jgi:hypothetical protein
MRFTLHYEGPLPAKASPSAKQRIREHLEPQLKELWTYSPLVAPDEGASRLLPRALTSRFGHTFAALVCDSLGLAAELDILMLRPSEPGQIIVGGGDIDNRLKTLFDALSAPQQSQQVPSGGRVTSEQEPLFVLLDDDNRIMRVNVDTDRLLAADSLDHVRLFIRVQTRVVRPSWHTTELGLS